jgi:hypothetical protein
MYETRHQRLAPIPVFLNRLSRNILQGTVIIAISLGLGMFGYHHLEKMSWVDAFENASMILSGMGPVSDLHTNSGKIFAGAYALFSGIIFLVVIGLVIAPILHRFLHKFHVDEGKIKSK